MLFSIPSAVTPRRSPSRCSSRAAENRSLCMRTESLAGPSPRIGKRDFGRQRRRAPIRFRTVFVGDRKRATHDTRPKPRKIEGVPRRRGIRVSTGLRGGAGRTRTGNQTVISSMLLPQQPASSGSGAHDSASTMVAERTGLRLRIERSCRRPGLNGFSGILPRRRWRGATIAPSRLSVADGVSGNRHYRAPIMTRRNHKFARSEADRTELSSGDIPPRLPTIIRVPRCLPPGTL